MGKNQMIRRRDIDKIRKFYSNLYIYNDQEITVSKTTHDQNVSTRAMDGVGVAFCPQP